MKNPMLPKEILRTVTLIKKNYKNPIIISILYNHLSSINCKNINVIDLKDDYLQMIVGSQIHHPMNVEKKINNFIKDLKANFGKNKNSGFNNGKEMRHFIPKVKKPFLSARKKFKLIVILYYLILKQTKTHIVIYELIPLLGISPFIDSLILKLVHKNIFSQIFSPKAKVVVIKNDVIEMVIDEVLRCSRHGQPGCLSANDGCSDKDEMAVLNHNLANILPLYAMVNKRPFDIPACAGFSLLRLLEGLTFYVKYAKNTDFIAEILRDNEFIGVFKNFIERVDVNSVKRLKRDLDNDKSLLFEEGINEKLPLEDNTVQPDNGTHILPMYDLKNFVESENNLFAFLKEEYESSIDKNRFKKELRTFLDSIL